MAMALDATTSTVELTTIVPFGKFALLQTVRKCVLSFWRICTCVKLQHRQMKMCNIITATDDDDIANDNIVDNNKNNDDGWCF